MDKIIIKGARTHNLKNINLIIPRNKLIVVSGLSGSGKSSLVFDTIYAEGQRRYIESISAYARHFLSLMKKPDVDYIEGLSPTISIAQKLNLHNPRSTVGTVTEIHDYLRLLFSRIGDPRCPYHNLSLIPQTISQMVDSILLKKQGKRLVLLANVMKEQKGEHSKILKNFVKKGYTRVRINGIMYDLSTNIPKLNVQKKHTIEVIIDRFKVVDNRIMQRLAESLEIALKISGGTAIITDMEKNTKSKELFLSANFSCPICGYSICELEPRFFSFNNPVGACPTCKGLGVKQYFDLKQIIQNPQLSIADGAIVGWNRNNFYRFQQLKAVSNHYKFNLEEPWNNLSTTIHNILLFGSGTENIEFIYINKNGDISVRLYPFEGILHNIEKKYKEKKFDLTCKALTKFISKQLCNTCKGSRLRYEASHVFVGNTALTTITDMSVLHIMDFFNNLKLSDQHAKIAEKIIKEINNRLRFLKNVGLGYLTLSRSTKTISSGEAQRIRLASQIGTKLVGVIYVLDEPSIGLHQRDNECLLETLRQLRNIGNTVIVVEHDENTIRAADHIIDIGPGAGVKGGKLVAEGSLEDIIAIPESLTGQYISRKRQISIPNKRIPFNFNKTLKLIGACGNNLKNVTLTLPIGLFTCITGVSGSGKSTLINNTLLPIIKRQLNGWNLHEPKPYCSIQGTEYFHKVIEIDQSPIGCTPRSNPAIYTDLFISIRTLFAGTVEARSRGYTQRRFSFNVRGGRCEACQGDGVVKIVMYFLPDTYILCDQCKGKRYNRETLEIRYKNKNIYEVLNMTIEEANEFFKKIPIIANKLQTMIDVGLGYIQLGQSSITLSGGESQRIKLSKELSKRTLGKTLYVLDEPTTGLHFSDIQQLINVLQKLRNQGNTIVVIEHNLEVIKTADWIVDLGPEGGSNGGEILVSGTPEIVAECKFSYTAKFLKPLLRYFEFS